MHSVHLALWSVLLVLDLDAFATAPAAFIASARAFARTVVAALAYLLISKDPFFQNKKAETEATAE